MRTIEEVIAELRNDIHSDVYLGKKTINTYLDEILEIHKAERPQGEWIYHKGFSESRECSVCGVWLDWSLVRNSFCPNCGADMRKEAEE